MKNISPQEIEKFITPYFRKDSTIWVSAMQHKGKPTIYILVENYNEADEIGERSLDEIKEFLDASTIEAELTESWDEDDKSDLHYWFEIEIN